MFVAGDPALDFLNSVATPVDVPVEWLDDGEGLLSWLGQAQLVSAAVLEQVRSESSLGELNKVAEQSRNLTTSKQGNSFELRAARKWRSAEALLMPIAEALARFVCSEDFTYVKACEGPLCTLLFKDRTRGRARRWCTMAICGNRAKQAAHRERLKANR